MNANHITAAGQPANHTEPERPRTKLLTLHHELLYPAFLSAALFEFAKAVLARVAPYHAALYQAVLGGPLGQVVASAISRITFLDCLWFFSALFFLLYFSAAFLALSEADEPENRAAFKFPSFAANLVEIGIILVVSILIAPTDEPLHISYLNYSLIYVSWVLIAFTGGVSNFFSNRKVRFILSLAAIAMGCLGLFVVGDTKAGYTILLATMYFLLVIYLCTVFHGPLPYISAWDFDRNTLPVWLR